MRWCALLGILLLSTAAACGRAEEPRPESVQRALDVSASVSAANDADVRFLVDLVRSMDGARMVDTSLRDALARRLRSDRSGYARLAESLEQRWRAHLDAEDEQERERTRTRAGSYALRSSLIQLVGRAGAQPGLLEEAAGLIEETTPSATWLNELSIRALHSTHASTVVKVALLYAAIVLGDEPDLQGLQDAVDLLSHVRLLYPARIPEDLEASGIRGLGLACVLPETGLHLLIPNAGYVFGGRVREGEIRGVDCGAFISHVLRSPTCWWTGGLEVVAKELLAPSTETPDIDWLQAGIKEFRLVRRDRGDVLLAGDVVVWRWISETGGRVGHVVLASERLRSDGGFRAVDARRDDDGSTEGIAVREYVLDVPDRDVYVLRLR